ncbi:6597997f-29f7-4ea2-850c-93dfbe9807b9 [Thermothielavioides terrestris]|uniref:6597997f-29f7-4ea2-850c-93dfbe9807b9 n=1 Tax=Thermothielavioides terrestris TaxID=2587410 RepID=A0A446BH88_9PEZI|nr:6597997f-29f7-4ea2-850c-93dfbe9807b9 [Thermothielavioides terrestris]
MTERTSSPRQVSFDDAPSSASDEDRTPVEVLFDESNRYRRKSSLVATDSVPPQLRSTPPPARRRTECLVHQFLANQRRPPKHHHHRHKLPHRRHPDQSPDRDAASVGRVHHPHAGTATCEAYDNSSEAGLDRSLDPKSTSHGAIPRSQPVQQDGNHDEEQGGEEEFAASHPYASIVADSRTATPTGSSGDDDDGDHDNDGSASASTTTHGQLDEKHWRREMVGKPALSRTPSQLDRRTASADAPTSRLLTKKQLSEMAWGVRELSRRLGSMRLRFRVKTIFLLTKIHDAELIAKTRELCRWLLDREREVRYTVYVDRELRENRKFDAAGLVEEVRRDFVQSGEVTEEASWDVEKRLCFWEEGMCRARPHTFDFVITLGGDGTVLYASWLFQRIVPPVLSFALGSLGFLTKFDFEEYKRTLTTAFDEGVTVSLRLRFEATVMRSQKTGSRLKQDGEHAETEVDGDGQDPPRDLVEELIGEEKDDEHTHRPDGTYEVLNEVVVDRGPNPTMSNIEIFGDDEHFTSVSADGICVSTPTGSTAYNLAAGGSLCHPENPVMLMTAICAHTLSFRPVVLPDTIVLRLGVPYDARTSSWASFDGRERVELRPGDYVTVSASRYPFACVQPHGRRSEDWINSISAKLGWNTRQRQKAFKEWGN